MAKNNSPGAMVRVSMEMPAIARGGVPTISPPVAAQSSSFVQSASDMICPTRVAQGDADRLMIAKGYNRLADDLASFMPPSRHQQHIACAQSRDGRRDRTLTVADL